MEFSLEALQGLVSRISEYATMETGLQLAVVAAALLVAGFIHRPADRVLSARLDRTALKLPGEVVLRLARRLVFPLAALLAVLLGLFVFRVLGYPVG
ncbi:MAG: hypothetical protein OEY45_00170, partial [Gammaproteobacteria bacterium]|nr:hypothetical protein [Gammaproteobacteria bacterium]